MNRLIPIRIGDLLKYCQALPKPVMESEIIREFVNPLCCGSDMTLYQKHFSLFHALYTIKCDPKYFYCMVLIHPMQIIIRNYPAQARCVHYEPQFDAFCEKETTHGSYCSCHHEMYGPANDVLYDPLIAFYRDSCNIDYEYSDELKKVQNGFKKFCVNRKQVNTALHFFSLNENERFDKAVLQKRYREMVKIYHPDRHTGDSFMIKEINAHYGILKDVFVV